MIVNSVNQINNQGFTSSMRLYLLFINKGTSYLLKLKTFLYFFFYFRNRRKKLAFSLTKVTTSCTQWGTPSFFCCLIKGESLERDEVSVWHFFLLTENLLRCGFCSIVLLSSLIKKCSLLIKSSAVSELALTFKELFYSILNGLGIAAHSLLLSKTFIWDRRQRRLMKLLVFDLRRLHF